MKNLLKVVFSMSLRIVMFPLRMLPLRNRRLVFTGLTGGSAYEYSCNLKYLCGYIREHYPKRFQIYWVVHTPERYKEKELEGICFLKHYSLRSFYYLSTAKVVVTSGSYVPWFPFRKKQYVINTWHGGGAYKRIENNKPDSDWATKKRAQICAGNISLFLSSCQKASELLFRNTFLYKGEIMECGMPRNDMLVRQDTNLLAKKVRTYYKVEADEKLLLYAPTYREMDDKIRLDGVSLIQALERSGAKWRVLMRAHRYTSDKEQFSISGKPVIDAGAYPDMQELLCAADMLITDYSSVIWDYSFLYRPGYLYVPDLEDYRKNNGFYVDISDWPFPMARSQKELEKLIDEYDKEAADEKIRQHHRYMENYETGHACASAVNRILDVCEDKLC